MTPANKTRDLEERTFEFARDLRVFVKRLPKSIGNREDVKQVVRSSGSVAANYIEANESLGNKDQLLHLKISRKECKETKLWLRLLDLGGSADLMQEQKKMLAESQELLLIFSSIILKLQKCDGGSK